MRLILICLLFVLCGPTGLAVAADVSSPNQNARDALAALKNGDEKRFFELTLKDAEGGSPESQMVVASIYERGMLGTSQDDAKALYWYERSASQGYSRAEARMAEICIQGKLMPRDLPASVEWLKKSALHGYAKANDYLGDSYLAGRGVEKDMKVAISYYLRAANANILASQIKLGGFYLRGDGVTADAEESYFWLYVAYKNPARAEFGDLSDIVEGAKKKLAPGVAEKIEKRADVFVASHPQKNDVLRYKAD
ncbi:MAG: tetratricopeptide repeat protein [Parvibaculaceae bacterium]